MFIFNQIFYRNFKKAFNDVVLSRRAIRNMNTLYPDATSQELSDADNVCIICRSVYINNFCLKSFYYILLICMIFREEMNNNAKKLPCNHIFHTACLRSWFQRQQTCPTCRLDILRPPASSTSQTIPNARQGENVNPPINEPQPQPQQNRNQTDATGLYLYYF